MIWTVPTVVAELELNTINARMRTEPFSQRKTENRCTAPHTLTHRRTPSHIVFRELGAALAARIRAISRTAGPVKYVSD